MQTKDIGGIQAIKASNFELQSLPSSSHNSGISNKVNVLAIFCLIDRLAFWLQEIMRNLASFLEVPLYARRS